MRMYVNFLIGNQVFSEEVIKFERYFDKNYSCRNAGTNCYIVGDPASGEGIIIDPGDEFSKIAAAIDNTKLKIKYLINTHGTMTTSVPTGK